MEDTTALSPEEANFSEPMEDTTPLSPEEGLKRDTWVKFLAPRLPEGSLDFMTDSYWKEVFKQADTPELFLWYIFDQKNKRIIESTDTV